MRRIAAWCVVALLLLCSVTLANARTRRHRKSGPVAVALQPFLLARSVVHTVADPIVSNAPRAIATVAIAPIRIAYRTARDRNDEPAVRRVLPMAEPGAYDQPIRVAYMVPRPQRPVNPYPDEAGEDDQDLDQELEPVPEPDPERSGQGPTVPGSRAVLRRGIAHAPSRAPQSVKNAIWAANSLRSKPYIWGGGHSFFYDRGYDCSGTVSFVLHGAGAIGAPLPSSDLMRYGKRGRGRWFTIYARPGHSFAVIAGLRLDTTDFQNGGNTGPRWHADMRDTRGYVARHPAGM